MAETDSDQSRRSRTVYVLGAGFTRAFAPRSPLLVDNYDVTELLDKFRDFPGATRILQSEIDRQPSGKLSIEHLMTRLDGRMPYDADLGAEEELAMLLASVKRYFVRRIRAGRRVTRKDDLANFANHCLERGITCITFNYDDVLDRALWQVKQATEVQQSPYWHPDGGYGFFCRPSESCVQEIDVFMDDPVCHLFKLHGSINWWPRLGYPKPYGVDAIVHRQDWLEGELAHPEGRKHIERHLEADPFIVPPVLTKSVLVDQPILRLIWSLAYSHLRSARKVVFVGYSLPTTDVGADFLFREALADLNPQYVRVVNFAQDEEEQALTLGRYRAVFRDLKASQFDFRGALHWCRRLVSTTPSAQAS